jgi:hypothetical protein
VEKGSKIKVYGRCTMNGKWICIRLDNGTTSIYNLDRFTRISFITHPNPSVRMEDDPNNPLYMFYQDLLRIVDVHPLNDDPVTVWTSEKIREMIQWAKEYKEALE